MGVIRSVDDGQRKESVLSGKIEYEDLTIPYQLIKSSRKSYAIQIKQGGTMIVRTPFHPSEQFLMQLFQEKEKWIKSKYLEQRTAADERMGGYNEAQRRYLENQYREAARTYIPKRVEFYIGITSGAYKRIAIRDQKTRWGSCSSSGTLSFNWRLMLAPPKVLDYVVVHELCHLIHMNHSKDFWQAVGKVMPDYLEYKNWLREHGSRLQNW